MVERMVVLMVILVLALAVYFIAAQNLKAQDIDRVNIDRPIFSVNASAESKSTVNTPGNRSINDSIRFIYDIAVGGQAKITPTLKSDMEVIPVISFKGVDVKRDPRIISTGESLYQYGDRMKIESYVPPLQYTNPSGNIDEFVEGQEYETGLLEDRNFIVYKIKLVKIDESFFSGTCSANFEVECQNSKDILIGMEQCTGTNTKDCSAPTREMCGGQMTVTMRGPVNCGARTVKDVEIETAFNSSPLPFDAGDTLLLSFFRNSECIRGSNDLEEMMNCSELDDKGNPQLDFLGNALTTFRVVPR